MTNKFELIAYSDRFQLNTPSTSHLGFRKIPIESILTIEDVKSKAKELKDLIKRLKADYDTKITLRGLNKSILEFETIYKRYLSDVDSINNKYNEALEFAKKYDNVDYSMELAEEIRDYSLHLQRKYSHYFYRNGSISICSEIYNSIVRIIDDLKFGEEKIKSGNITKVSYKL